ncbi:MAG TPA: hypothetical protein VN625_02555, partial [Desulfuromonadaceae bacterium]|nr:hypothetical protein [Desulfuromonadaceae bacterium]
THHIVRQVPPAYTAPNNVCFYSKVNGVEDFHLTSTNASRIEIRLVNEYQAPAEGRQFEGDVMILPSTGHQSLMQIFGNYAHATLFMLHGCDAYNGSLRHYDREVLMTNVYETWVHVNVIHMPGQFVRVYLNGIFKGEWPDDSMDHSHYFKYGCYGTLDAGSAWVRWKNVKFFVGGNPPVNRSSEMADRR